MDKALLGMFFTAAAYIVGSIVFFVFTRARGFDRRQSAWLLATGLCGGIIGAKVCRLLFGIASGANPAVLLAHPDGRTIIGGVLFGWVAVEFAKSRLKISRSTGDGFALALSSGEAIGRIGCFFNGCCYGATCSLPWAVYQAGELRHPAQLYSAFVALSIFLLLCFLRNKVKYEGDLFRIYLLCFAMSRFALEFVRQRSDIHFGLSIAQWVSIEITAAAVVGIVWAYRSHPQTQESIVVHEREIL